MSVTVIDSFAQFQDLINSDKPVIIDFWAPWCGSIVPLLSWTDEADVIARANDTKMGLGASVWTNDLTKASRVARGLQAGNVWVNTHFDLSPSAPFGGHKESGIGTEWGANGLKGFCDVQTLF